MKRLALWVGLGGVALVLVLSFVPLDSVIRRIPRGGRSYQEWRLLAFLTVAFVLGLGVSTTGDRVKVVFGIAALVAGVELAQLWSPSHHSSFGEFATSVLAAIIGVTLGAVTTHMLSRIEAPEWFRALGKGDKPDL